MLLVVNLLMVNRKCFSLVDLLHRLYCMVITELISPNKHGCFQTATHAFVMTTVV